MDDGHSVIGFTEAQLGFTLVLLVLVVGIALSRARPEAVSPSPISPDSAAALRARIERLRRELDSLRSPILPTCRSRGLVAGPILSVVASGTDRFLVDGKEVSSSDIDVATADKRKAADDAGCRQEIVFRVRPDITAAASEADRRLLISLRLRIITPDE